ncbi:MAG: TlpA disulfide reductase family protein [Verrucomicrobiota bacterium]|nr:TlpA disulfide reductase family protein [Verrucomicrobiota bacterium]
MKLSRFLIGWAGALGMVLVFMASPALGRTWKLSNGDTVDGDLVSYKNGTVIITKSAGGRALFVIEKFSAGDQALIRQSFPDGDKKAAGSVTPKTTPKSTKTTPIPATGASNTQQAPKGNPTAQASDDPKPERGMPKPGKFSIGQPAPSETGGSLRDGTIVSLAQLRGKLVVVEFVGLGSDVYQNEAPTMVDIYEQAKPLGFEIITVYLDKNRGEVIKFREEHKMTWPYMLDMHRRTCDKWGVDAIPTRVLVDQNGLIIADQVSVNNIAAYLNKYLQLK